MFLKEMGQSRPLFDYFCLFHITHYNKLIKALMVWLGLEPRVAGWKVQMNPLSYGVTQHANCFEDVFHDYHFNFSQLNQTILQTKGVPWGLITIPHLPLPRPSSTLLKAEILFIPTWVNTRRRPVWPDIELKFCPNVSKSCPNRCQSSFYI